jgi:hypothetical protein
MARRQNYFQALDMDEPEFVMGPSLIASHAAAAGGAAVTANVGLGAASAAHGGAGRTGCTSDCSSGECTSCGGSTATARGMGKDGAGGGAGLDLSSVADEILSQAKALGPTSAAAAWDFSGLAATTAEERAAMEKAAADAERAKKETLAARLADLHERERVEMAERLHMAEVSHRERVRRLESKTKGQGVLDRAATKYDRKMNAKKRRNQAKHSY